MTGCGAEIGKSNAYKFGKETGSKWRDLSSEIEVLATWFSENNVDATLPEVDKENACKAMWLAIGWPKFGLKDMSKNRTDFVEGCLTTVGK